MPVVSSPLNASSSVRTPVAEHSASIRLFHARESADMTARFMMSHGVICASAPALSLGIIREATTVKFLPCSARICESQTHHRPLAHHLKETTVSEAIEQLKANLPTHPPVDSLKPLEEDYTGLRILAVHAHPDDESSKGAGTASAYIARGARFMVATMTGGERGDILNEEIDKSPRAHRDLPGLRRAEMAAAREIMGIEHRWIGFFDSGLPEGDPMPPLPFGSFGTMPLDRAAAPLVRLVREYRPHIIITYDEIGGYPHPDHIMTHKVAVEAFEKAGDPEAYVGEGEPWTPLKLYYDRAFNPERTLALHEHLLDTHGESLLSGWIENLAHRASSGEAPRHETTTRILVHEHFEQRDQALRAHASQVDPNGVFFAVPSEQLKDIWPWEDYTLAASHAEVQLPESSLDEGLSDYYVI